MQDINDYSDERASTKVPDRPPAVQHLQSPTINKPQVNNITLDPQSTRRETAGWVGIEHIYIHCSLCCPIEMSFVHLASALSRRLYFCKT